MDRRMRRDGAGCKEAFTRGREFTMKTKATPEQALAAQKDRKYRRQIWFSVVMNQLGKGGVITAIHEANTVIDVYDKKFSK